jgi:Ubiquitin carboxyl-terminal hydrolase
MVRGIANLSGTACHLSGALVLLRHTLRPLANALILYSHLKEKARKRGLDLAAFDVWAAALGGILDDLSNEKTASVNGNQTFSDDAGATRTGAGADAVDPTRFHDAVREYLGIEAHALGDATTALVKILQSLRGDSRNAFEPLLKQTVDGGLMQSIIEGTSILAEIDGDQSVEKRIKRTRLRPLTNPLALSVGRLTNELDDFSVMGLIKSLLQAESVENYKWVEGSYERIVQPRELALSACDGKVTRRLQIATLPNILMLHVERNHDQGMFVGDSQHKPKGRKLDVPLVLDLASIVAGSSRDETAGDGIFPGEEEFNLLGGLLLKGDEGNRTSEDDGHYLALVQQQLENMAPAWFLVDDEDVFPVSSEQALDMFSGGAWSDVYPSDQTQRTATVYGVLLIYARKDSFDPTRNAAMAVALQEFEDELSRRFNVGAVGNTADNQSDVDWSLPKSIVGRRVRIKWANGKFFGGQVAAYIEATRKHRVVYDDGDVREYRLEKKEIVWE